MTTGIRAGASASDTRLSLVKEAVWGTTPATPAFVNTRFTSENLQLSKETVRSNEIRPDRNVIDEILVGRSAAGNLDFELSYSTFDDLLESVFFAEWAGDTLKNGASEGQSFTAERTLALAGGVKEYHRFSGLVANTMSLSIQAGQIVTGSFGMMGKFGGRGDTPIADATYADANQEQVINATSHFASLVAGVPGSSNPVPLVRSISLEVTNNLRVQQAVGNVDAVGLGAGRFEASGSMECYFSSGDLLQSFIDHDDLALSFTIGTATGKKYTFTLPTIKLTGDPGANASGNDADIMLTLNFTAVLDRLTTPTPLGCALMIERAVA